MIRPVEEGVMFAGEPIDGHTPAPAPLRFAPPIRPGSWVRQRIPLNIARVGYPRAHQFYKDLVREDPEILAALQLTVETVAARLGMDPRLARVRETLGGGIIQGVARYAADLDSMGGGTRRIFWKPSTAGDRPQMVSEVSSIVEGDYYPSSGGGEDYENAGLANTRHWRVLHLDSVDIRIQCQDTRTVREHVEAIPRMQAGDRWRGPSDHEWLVCGMVLRRRDDGIRWRPIADCMEAGDGGDTGWSWIGPATERTVRLVKQWSKGRPKSH